MAYVEVRKGGELVSRRAVDAEKAQRGCVVRLGKDLKATLTVGQVATIGSYEVRMVEGDMSGASDLPGVSGAMSVSVSSAGDSAWDSAQPPVEPDTIPSVTTGLSVPADTDCESAPKISGYRIIGRLGRGGMGTVWQAVQFSTNRRVALKVLSSAALGSAQARARFEREVGLASRLALPNIAQVYDSSLHAGVHCYAMQLIDGMHLDRYVADKGLSQREIIRLMIAVVRAVESAHQRGVMHRDLKPSNILVTRHGEPWIVDFGLAKDYLDRDKDLSVSIAGQAPGTPAYMSPEQAAGKTDRIDTRTDTYSLGVILYQLLTDRFPHDLAGTPYQVLQRIAETDPRSPRQVTREVDQELEAVLLKALAREPGDRYPSTGHFADDLRRYLDNEPIIARRPSLGLRLLKWSRRHKALVAAAAVTLAVAVASLTVSAVLIASAYGSETAQRKLAQRNLLRAQEQERLAKANLLKAQDQERLAKANLLKAQEQEEQAKASAATADEQRLRAQVQQRKADDEAERAKAVTKFLQDMLGWIDPAKARGREATVEEALDRAAEQVDKQFAGELVVQGRLRQVIGQTYLALGKHEQAFAQLSAAVGIFRDLFAGDNRETLAAMSTLGDILDRQGKYAEAGEIHRQTLEARRNALGRDDPDTGVSMLRLASVLEKLEGHAEARRLREEWDTIVHGAEPKGAPRTTTQPDAGGVEITGKDLRRLVALNPNIPGAYANLVRFLTECAEPNAANTREALGLAKRAVQLAPSDGFCRGALGMAYYYGHNWPAAAASLDRAIRLGAEAGEYRFYLAMAQWRSGHRAEAHKYCAQANDWMDRNAPNSPYLRSIRDQAALLLSGSDLLVTPRFALRGHHAEIRAIGFYPRDGTLVTADIELNVRRWNTAGGKLMNARSLIAPKDLGKIVQVNDVVLSRDCGRLAASIGTEPESRELLARHGSKGKVHVWNLATTKGPLALEWHPDRTNYPAFRIAFSPEGSSVATVSGLDLGVRVFSVATGLLRGTDYVKAGGILYCLAYAPDGKTLAVGTGYYGTVGLWRPPGPVEPVVLKAHSGSVHSLAFSPTGKALASAGMDGAVILWDVGAARKLATFDAGSKDVQSLAFSPDGDLLIWGGRGIRDVKLWDLSLRIPAATLKGDGQTDVATAAFSPSGRTIATGMRDGTVRLWDVTRATDPASKPYVPGKLLWSQDWRRTPALPHPPTTSPVAAVQNQSSRR